jgi:hypothetical protein
MEKTMKDLKPGLYYVPEKDYTIYIRNIYHSTLMDRNGMQTSGYVGDIEVLGRDGNMIKHNGIILLGVEALEFIGKV